MTKTKGLFVGFGSIASRVFELLQDEIEADVLKRSPMHELSASIQRCFSGDVSLEATWQAVDQDYRFAVFCLTPGGYTASDYRKVFLEGLQRGLSRFRTLAMKPHIFFVSSTSVYAQETGLVDETSPAEGASETSRVLRSAERYLEESGFDYTIVRYSGIYGGTRARLMQQVLSGQPVLSADTRMSNRIHEDDAIGFLAFLVAKVLKGQAVNNLYIASDSEPVDLNEVYKFIAAQTGQELNTEPAGQVSRRSGNKQISNQRMLQTGYRLKYPDFRSGYAEMCGRLKPSSTV